MFHGVVAAHLPLSVYYYTSHLFSADTALLSAVFSAASLHLTMLGTHPLLNSFISPLLFLCLGVVLRSFDALTSVQAACPVGAEYERTRTKGLGAKCPTPIVCENTPDSAPVSDTREYRRLLRRRNVGKKKHATHQRGTTTLPDCASYSCWKCGNGIGSDTVAPSSDGGNHTKVTTRANNNGAYEAIGGNTVVTDRQDSVSLLLKPVLCGVVLGLLSYVRPDALLFQCMVVIAYMCKHVIVNGFVRRIFVWTFVLTMGYCIGALIGGFDDYMTYGVWFISPCQWLKFNVQTSHATDLFGTQELSFYFKEIILNDKVLGIMSLVTVICLLLFATNYFFRKTNMAPGNNFIGAALICLLMFSIYSLKGHKEIRFVHNGIVLLGIVSAEAVLLLYSFLSSNVRGNKLFAVKALTLSVATIALSNNIIKSTFCTVDYLGWRYLQEPDSNYINDCLDFVGRQNDTRGVFLSRSLYLSAGYSVLHKDVPLFTRIHAEYHEFDRSSRRVLPTRSLPAGAGLHATVSVSIPGRVADFVTAANAPFVLKRLATTRQYNYAIVERNRVFIDVGFSEVFASGTMRVLARIETAAGYAALEAIADSIPMGRNGTTLEYEGSWLYSFGLYHKAIERLEHSLLLDDSRVRCFQLLALAYDSVGAADKARLVMRHCEYSHGKRLCNERQHSLPIDERYRR